MEEPSRKRFVRSLRAAQEQIAKDARCFCYEHEKDYLEVKEDLKFAIRMLEEGENFAGKLLYKNAQTIAPKTAMALAEHAKNEEEQKFYAFVGNMNLRRTQGACPVYNNPQYMQLKRSVFRNYLDALEQTKSYYTPIFNSDPWFLRQMADAKRLCEDTAEHHTCVGHLLSEPSTGAEPGTQSRPQYNNPKSILRKRRVLAKLVNYLDQVEMDHYEVFKCDPWFRAQRQLADKEDDRLRDMWWEQVDRP